MFSTICNFCSLVRLNTSVSSIRLYSGIFFRMNLRLRIPSIVTVMSYCCFEFISTFRSLTIRP